MKPELDRVKNDLETMQKAIGLPSFGREWLQWLKRDTWLNLWWCLPGFILIASAALPVENTKKFLGLAIAQWVGLLVCAVLVGMLLAWGRITRNEARPAGLLREYKRLNTQGSWFLPAFLVQFALYLVWGRQHHIDPQAFMAGMWLLCGSAVLMLAVFTKAWVYLGWAIPFVIFGLCQPLIQGRSGGLWMGLMFIGAAFLCSVIQVWQVRGMERQNDAY
jgi:hypothetical protein